MCGSDCPVSGGIICELKSVTQSCWHNPDEGRRGAPYQEASHRYDGYVFTRQGASMPLARIDLLEGKTPEYRCEAGRIIYQALLDCFSVPKDDLFQIITEHPRAELQFDRNYLGIQRSDDCIFVQITLSTGRT